MTIIVEESTLTAKGQTTVPKAVRQALGIDPGDRIAFRIDERGVTVERGGLPAGDPALGPFLNLLARDVEQRPEALRDLTPEFAARIAALTAGAEVELDAPIEGEVAL